MNTVLKVLFVFICFVCLWNLSPLPEMIVITQSNVDLSETFVVTGVLIPLSIMAVLGLIILLFSLIGAVLVTIFIVAFTLLVVGMSFSWPILFAGLAIYWILKSPNSQKV